MTRAAALFSVTYFYDEPSEAPAKNVPHCTLQPAPAHGSLATGRTAGCEGAAAARLLLRMRHQQCAWLELLDERIAFCLCRLTHGGKADKVACVADLAVRPATFSCCGILMLPQACQVHIAEKPLAVAWHNQFTLGRAWPLRQLAVAANLFRGGSFG